MLEMWRNCLVLAGAGAAAGGEISGNGTMAGQAARQLSIQCAPTAKVAQG